MEECASFIIKLPKKRIGALIGAKGEIKKEIEKKLKSKLSISSDGEVHITSKDPLCLMKAKDVVTAISRGFSPLNALALCDEEKILDIIHLSEYIGKRKNALYRHRSRLIGTGGKVRRNIELATKTSIAIFGKTVAIIGMPENVNAARQAIEKLISGRSHKSVYSFIDKRTENMA